MTSVRTDLGGGIWGFDVYIDDTDQKSLSYFADNLTFTGPILQNKAFGSIDVNDNANADSFTNIAGSGYSKLTDSYFFQPWTGNTVSPGIVETSGSYSITAGTGSGSQFNKIQIAYIAATGDVTFSGTIGRNALDFPVAGLLHVPVPEPASIVLLMTGLGLSGLVPALCRKRRKK